MQAIKCVVGMLGFVWVSTVARGPEKAAQPDERSLFLVQQLLTHLPAFSFALPSHDY
jgi:hypothetical protein